MFKRNSTYIVFYDLESTGLNYFHENITEIGAVTQDNQTFQTFVNPLKPIPTKITELTNITNEMVQYAPNPENAVRLFLEFIVSVSNGKQIVLIAHNGNNFDHLFLKRYFKQYNIEVPDIIYFDTITLSKYIAPKRESHSLRNICKYYNITQENAHRADDDARCLKLVYDHMTQLPFTHVYDMCYL